MELASCHPSDAQNLEVEPRFLENLRTPGNTVRPSNCTDLIHKSRKYRFLGGRVWLATGTELMSACLRSLYKGCLHYTAAGQKPNYRHTKLQQLNRISCHLLSTFNLSNVHHIHQQTGCNRMGLTIVSYRKWSWIHKWDHDCVRIQVHIFIDWFWFYQTSTPWRWGES